MYLNQIFIPKQESKDPYDCQTKFWNSGHCDYMEERMNACQKLIDLTNAGEFKFSQECYRKETGEGGTIVS